MAKVQSSKRVRLAQRRKKIRIIKFAILAACTILAYAGLSYALAQDWAVVRHINVNGNSTVSAAAIEVSVLTDMASLRAYSLYAGTILTYDKPAIINTLQYKYPQLLKVELSPNGLHQLDISVVEREPVVLWCNHLEECYFVDYAGYIYRKVTNLEQAKGMVRYIGEGVQSPLRSKVLVGKFEEVQEFLQTLERIGLSPQIVEQLDNKELLIHSLAHPKLRIRLDADLSRVGDYVDAVLNSADYKEYTASGVEPEYIDLRFGNRVYYK